MWIYTIESCIWNATIIVSSARTVLKQREPRAISAYFLQPFSSKIRFSSTNNNIKIGLNIIALRVYIGKSFKPSSKKTWENLPLL